MRGVYVDTGRVHAAPAGSSPHARGLLNEFKSKVITDQDHPRMRGVYH